jgi:hypothetical protein
MSAPLLILGREGLGADEGDEQAFEAWVEYVCDHIDKRCGFGVGVARRGHGEIQTDEIRGGTDEQRETIGYVKQDLWNDWCAEGAPGVEVTS